MTLSDADFYSNLRQAMSMSRIKSADTENTDIARSVMMIIVATSVDELKKKTDIEGAGTIKSDGQFLPRIPDHARLITADRLRQGATGTHHSPHIEDCDHLCRFELGHLRPIIGGGGRLPIITRDHIHHPEGRGLGLPSERVTITIL